MDTSRIVFGTGGLRDREVFREAYRAGFRDFDTAVYYANDGEILSALDECGAGDDVRLVHKVQPYRVTEQFERVIRPKLGGRTLDALLLHHPALFVFDASVDALMAPWRELEALFRQGVARRIGLSNAGAGLIDYLWEHASVQPRVNQIECHPAHHDEELLRSCRERGIEVQCFSPLGGGRVRLLESPVLGEIARATGRSVSQVCLRWLLQKGLVPVVRTRTPEHMRDNLEASTFSLDPEQMAAIDGLDRGELAWDDPIKRGSFAATVTSERIRVPNRLRFGIRSALHYLLVELFLRRRAEARSAPS